MEREEGGGDKDQFSSIHKCRKSCMVVGSDWGLVVGPGLIYWRLLVGSGLVVGLG